MSEIIEEYLKYIPTPQNSAAVIKIIAAERNLQDWEVMKELVLSGDYVSPSEAVTKKKKETSADILNSLIEKVKLKGYEDCENLEETFKRLTKKCLYTIHDLVDL